MSDLASVGGEFYGVEPEVTAEKSRDAARVARRNAETRPFLKIGKGDSEFESVDNTEWLESNLSRMGETDNSKPATDGPKPKDTEEMSSSEREAWLKDGTLPEAVPEAKKKEKAPERPATEEAQPGGQLPALTDLDREYTEAGERKAWSEPAHQQALAGLGERLAQEMPKLANYDAVQTALKTRDVAMPPPLGKFLEHTLAESNNPAAILAELALDQPFALKVVNDYNLAWNEIERLRASRASAPAVASAERQRLAVLSAFRETLLTTMGKNGKGSEGPSRPRGKTVTDALPPPREVGGTGIAPADEEEAALKADDFTRYQKAANDREVAKLQASRGRRRR